jgi:hypothetical protein
MRKQLVGTLALTLAALSNAGAQVGYEPARSPYRDLEKAHEITYFSGYYRAHVDPAGVAPRNGPMMGILYQWLVGGPINLTAEVARVASERRVLDPDRPATCASGPVADCKLIAMYRWPLYLTDLGLALNLTGGRTYHRLVPELRAGLGFVSDFHTQVDVGDFGFGTKFAMSYGAAIRWVPGGRYQMRFGYADRIFTVKYPESYFSLAPDSSRIRPLRTKPTAWMNNRTFTLGLSYLFGR